MLHPMVVHADDDILVLDKPAGVNTHRATPEGQEGLYEWARRVLTPDGALGLLHRLDKETSGLIVFGRSARANAALAEQLESRTVSKRYLLLARHDPLRPRRLRCDAKVPIKKRRGRPASERDAVTEFEVVEPGCPGGLDLIEARPLTGRTHQIRLHAARLGMPIVGDAEYGGPPGARLFLHAAALELRHPGGAPLRLAAPRPESFDAVLRGERPGGPRVAARAALESRTRLVDPARTDAFLWIDRHHDGLADVRVERLGAVALAIRYDDAAGDLPPAWVAALLEAGDLRALVEQRRPRSGPRPDARVVAGDLPARAFVVREHDLRYRVDLDASPTSSGLFLDQRETRRRLLTEDLTGKTVLNAFAHTGSLSVAAARAGAETLTLDLSQRYLEWAQENLRLNGLDPGQHDFIYGDALEWMARLDKKGRRFDRVLLDPPSASTSGRRGKKQRWTVERDLDRLVALGARLVAPGGSLFVSTNLRRLRWARFQELIAKGLSGARRTGEVEPWSLPLDHRTAPGDPPYLKAAWIALDGS